MIPMFGIRSRSFVWRQVGYSIADVLAKCLFGLLIYKIAARRALWTRGVQRGELPRHPPAGRDRPVGLHPNDDSGSDAQHPVRFV